MDRVIKQKVLVSGVTSNGSADMTNYYTRYECEEKFLPKGNYANNADVDKRFQEQDLKLSILESEIGQGNNRFEGDTIGGGNAATVYDEVLGGSNAFFNN